MSSDFVILGAGLAGLSAAFHLKENYEIFEKSDRVGGLCKSEKINDLPLIMRSIFCTVLILMPPA